MKRHHTLDVCNIMTCRSCNYTSRAILLRWLLCFTMTALSHGWLPTSRIQFDRSLRRSSFVLWMATKPPTKNSSFKGKKRKNEEKSSTGKSRSPGKSFTKSDASSSSLPTPRRPSSETTTKITSTTKASVALPSNNKHRAPPWQVLSNKDAKVNVEKEKQRRELVRQGDPTAGTKTMTTPPSNAMVSTDFLSEVDRSLLRWRPFNPSTVPKGMQYIGSYLGKKLPPRLGVPEIAFLGRSNVGKSSLLNRLAAMTSSSSSTTSSSSSSSSAYKVSSSSSSAFTSIPKDQARVGKTPGATAAVNLYAMLGSRSQQKEPRPILGLTDLPGFGYAKLSKEVQESVQEAAERYLAKREELALGILLVDIRRNEPSDDDRAVLAALYDLGLPLLVVATKVDKLSSERQLELSLAGIQQGLGLPDGQPLCVSSVTGQGVKELWRIILEACEDKVQELNNKLTRSADDRTKEDEEEDGGEGIEVEDYQEEDEDEIFYSQGS